MAEKIVTDRAAEARVKFPQIAFADLVEIVSRRRKVFLGVVGACAALCLLYWLIAPSEYEAVAKVGVRTAPATVLKLNSPEPQTASSVFSVQLQQETLANVLRSDRLAWKVIVSLKLYRDRAFSRRFSSRFADFHPDSPTPAAQAYLLELFARDLQTRSLPQTLLVEIRFRSRDPKLAERVAKELILSYSRQENEAQVENTKLASVWLQKQLAELKIRLMKDQEKMAIFQQTHGVLSMPEIAADGRSTETQRSTVFLEVNELGRRVAEAAAARIEREAEYKSAIGGDPEMTLASSAKLQTEDGDLNAAVLREIRSRRGAFEQENAQLRLEHGPNFPRLQEIESELRDLERQRLAEDAKLVERFRASLQSAREQEAQVRRELEARTVEAMRVDRAAAEYAAMYEELESNRALYLRLRDRVDEAVLTAGAEQPALVVADPPRTPAEPISPNLAIDLCIAVFAGLWLALGGVLWLESKSRVGARAAALLVCMLMAALTVGAQPPTPNISGLPSGVARIPLSHESKSVPDAKQAPAVWNMNVGESAGAPVGAAALGASLATPISAGDFLDVSEYRTPEFHTEVHVTPDGKAPLPFLGEISLLGLDEQSAARTIEAALVAKEILLHPHVRVLVVAYMGQDVSVLGEVNRPGVYPYTVHHRLLDLISAASGLTTNAGRLVNVFHRSDPKIPHPIVLDPSGSDSGGDHNPELEPGDTVQVSRAGLVYVIGDVVRPGGFAVDPSQRLTIVQALSLAWGPAQNASSRKAILIREQKGGRTITALNLKRLLQGKDPDQPIYDRDILYVPSSTAKNLWNRTIESAMQSLAGVSIYSALVYSQRY